MLQKTQHKDRRIYKGTHWEQQGHGITGSYSSAFSRENRIG